MMVYPYKDQLLVILQIDHSRVAGLLAAHWGNETFAEPRPWSSFVLAAQEHDHGWWEWEIRPTINEQGYPPDYVSGGGIPRDVHVAFDRNGINRVLEQDPYAGMLIAMHQAGLNNQGYGMLTHMPNRTQMPEVASFIQEQDGLRARMQEQLSRDPKWAEYVTDDQIWWNYKLLEAQEQLAQIICNRYPTNSTERRNGPPAILRNVPTAPGKEDVELSFEPVGEDEAIIRPWPFDKELLTIVFPARLMPNRSYTGQEEFLRDFYRAEPIALTARIRA